jgi:hypothetical protein
MADDFGMSVNPVLAMSMPSETTPNDGFVSNIGPENPCYGPTARQPEHLGEPFIGASGLPIPPSLPIHAVDPFRLTHGAPDYDIHWDRG